MPRDLSKFLKTDKPLTEFAHAVISIILKIPRGQVATYGQIAEIAGFPQRPRQVGMVLRFLIDSDRVPWQRVVGANGRIAFPPRNAHRKLQIALLKKEGVRFLDEAVDLERYRWKKKAPKPRGPKPKMFSE